jgi:hypothetical protein
LINLSTVYHALKNKDKSKKLAEEAYNIIFDSYGPNHLETKKALSNLESQDS